MISIGRKRLNFGKWTARGGGMREVRLIHEFGFGHVKLREGIIIYHNRDV